MSSSELNTLGSLYNQWSEIGSFGLWLIWHILTSTLRWSESCSRAVLFFFFSLETARNTKLGRGIYTAPSILPWNTSRSQELLLASEYISFASAFSYTQSVVWSLLCHDLQYVPCWSPSGAIPQHFLPTYPHHSTDVPSLYCQGAEAS